MDPTLTHAPHERTVRVIEGPGVPSSQERRAHVPIECACPSAHVAPALPARCLPCPECALRVRGSDGTRNLAAHIRQVVSYPSLCSEPSEHTLLAKDALGVLACHHVVSRGHLHCRATCPRAQRTPAHNMAAQGFERPLEARRCPLLALTPPQTQPRARTHQLHLRGGGCPCSKCHRAVGAQSARHAW